MCSTVAGWVLSLPPTLSGCDPGKRRGPPPLHKGRGVVESQSKAAHARGARTQENCRPMQTDVC
eukprot:8775882-Lingulodinium_polyedra.AAC.1